MKVDNEALRRAFDEEAGGAPRARRGCPPVSLAERVILEEAGEAERIALAEHLLACPDCAGEYRAAGSLEEIGIGSKPAGRPASQGAGSVPWLAWSAAAAVAMAALGISTAWLLSRRQPEPAAVERGTASTQFVVSPPDGASLPQPPEKFSWAPVEGAESYRVVLFDAESTPVWEAKELTRAEAPLPDTARDRLRKGGSFYWKVETLRRAERVSSDLHRFSIPPPGR